MSGKPLTQKPTNRRVLRFETDLIGKKFGLLTIRAMLPDEKCLCDCDCGSTGLVKFYHNLRKLHTKSCGCQSAKMSADGHATHGESRGNHRSAEYRIWCNMRQRCLDKNCPSYQGYGARGITICEEWANNFAAFLDHIGRRPGPGFSVDRIDNSRGYEPGNVRWATSTEQNRNRRDNRIITVDGRTASMAEWGEITGLGGALILRRLMRGWSEERAVSEPRVQDEERTRRSSAARLLNRTASSQKEVI